jgi:hypothetical protein
LHREAEVEVATLERPDGEAGVLAAVAVAVVLAVPPVAAAAQVSP